MPCSPSAIPPSSQTSSGPPLLGWVRHPTNAQPPTVTGDEGSERVGFGDVTPPTGVVTFLFTDVEGSTALWAADDAAMATSLALHDQILRETMDAHGGYVFTTAGDSFAVAFQSATAGVAAAVAAQEQLGRASWPGPSLRVRMGLHLGETVERGGDYFGPVVNLTARLEAAGHGGQVLVTDAVRSAAGVDTIALGSHPLRDVPDPVEIHQIGDGDFPPLRVAGAHRTNLPVAPWRLIGRDRELATVREALEVSRLVTLAAAGGTGKTRLALEVGEALLNHQAGGVWFVDLSTVVRDQDVASAIASVLDLQVSGDAPVRQVVEYLSGIDALVVLDNCEHVVDACAELLETFLRAPGSSRVLATTREYFDIDGERAIRLGALDTDDVDSPGVELFVERALASDAAMTFDAEDRDDRRAVWSPRWIAVGHRARSESLRSHDPARAARGDRRTLRAAPGWAPPTISPGARGHARLELRPARR